MQGAAAFGAPAVVAGLFGLVLVLVNRTWLMADGFEQAQVAATSLADAAVLPVLSIEDLQQDSLGPERTAELANRLAPVIGPHFLNIKIWSRQGTMLFATDGTEGEHHPVEELQAALMGRSAGRLEHAIDPVTGQSIRVLEMYVPVDIDRDGVTDGVFELYTDYSSTGRAIGTQLARTLVLFGVMTIALYASLVRVARDLQRARTEAASFLSAAMTDPLTGLVNRRGFEATLATLRAKASATFVSLLYLDLDGFKAVNDAQGHHAGDLLLAAVAGRLRDSFRRDTVIARLGGDEFAVVLDAVDDPATVESCAERLRARLCDPVRIGPDLVRVSASIGAVTIPIGALVVDDLVRGADEAMYAAKLQGKNAVVHRVDVGLGEPRSVRLASERLGAGSLR